MGGKMSRKWQPSPVFLHGKSHVERSLVAYSPWGHKESDTTEQLSTMEKTKINFSSMCEFGQGVDFIRQFTESKRNLKTGSNWVKHKSVKEIRDKKNKHPLFDIFAWNFVVIFILLSFFLVKPIPTSSYDMHFSVLNKIHFKKSQGLLKVCLFLNHIFKFSVVFLLGLP